MIKRHSN